MVLTAVLDYVGVATFAMVSTIGARDRRLDLVSSALLAAVAGVGGGTLRDLLLDRTVFWLHNPGYLYVCGGAATVVWFVGAGPRRRQTLLFLDALGVSAFAVVGTLIARETGVPAPVAAVMGLLTATCGGILRDVLAAEHVVLVRRDVYVTVALLSSVVFLVAVELGMPLVPAAICGASVGSVLRILVITRRWQLPAPPRT
ncbi:MAG: trimeric intracellular cation channel family protein [Actinophytocola sp.]|uniref:trimeric intracellular cation channel family protein n=1 Tax=Actinophytocola sp. TaxID=1872138 RepID=UPI003C782BC6